MAVLQTVSLPPVLLKLLTYYWTHTVPSSRLYCRDDPLPLESTRPILRAMSPRPYHLQQDVPYLPLPRYDEAGTAHSLRGFYLFMGVLMMAHSLYGCHVHWHGLNQWSSKD